jgi:hypothetical protein
MRWRSEPDEPGFLENRLDFHLAGSREKQVQIRIGVESGSDVFVALPMTPGDAGGIDPVDESINDGAHQPPFFAVSSSDAVPRPFRRARGFENSSRLCHLRT